jgi:2-keto-4-pentenoate hydratase/2-oxohepta-3-ene-1,7-dioic acid hydratase in catechol pathway
MILATFARDGGQPRIGSVDRERGTMLDLQAAHKQARGREDETLESMLALIESGSEGLALAGELDKRSGDDARCKLEAVRLLAPVPIPTQIREFSLFEQHIRDAPRASARIRAKMAGQPQPEQGPTPARGAEIFYRQPAFYIMNRFNVVGPEADVEWPDYSAGYFDFELEIGMYISKRGKNIPRARAHEHIFGYTIFNDFSAREQQWREMETRLGPSKGKSFDTGNVTGPWIVTSDEMGDVRDRSVEVRINGETWASTTTKGMLHSFEDIIAYTSKDETLQAGELFASGTVGGCCGMEMDRWVKVGDVVELEVAGIGKLRNRIVAARKAA